MEQKSLAVRGRELVHNLDLRELREQFGFSRTAQAHMIGVSPTALRDWEQGLPLSRTSAERIAGWHVRVVDFLGSTDREVLGGIHDGTLLHVTVASQQLAMSWGTIEQRCRTGLLECVDLGPLGTYVRTE